MDSSKHTVKITPVAVEDLKEILDYIVVKLSSPASAQKLLDDFLEGVERASMFPYAMPLMKNKKISSRNYRKIFVRNYVALFLIDEDKKEIRIMRVRYSPSSLSDSL